MTDSEPTESPATTSEETVDEKTVKLDRVETPEQPSLECRIETYHAIAEWIRFADAKAAVLLTVGGALAGFLIPSVHTILFGEVQTKDHLVPFWSEIVLSLFSAYLVFFILSSVSAFLCINPLRTRGRHPSLDDCQLFHPAAISHHFRMNDVEQFRSASKAGGEDEMHGQVLAAILLDSHISSVKYQRVTMSIRLFAVSAAFGFFYYLIAQL